MNWVWTESTTGGTERLLLLAIADNAADDGTNAYPSLATLARKVRLDERTVRRLLRKLESARHIAVSVGTGPRGTNRYTVIMHSPVGNSVPTPGQIAPQADCPPDNEGTTPDTVTPPSPGHNCAPQTSLNFQRTSNGRASAPVRPAGKGPTARRPPAGSRQPEPPTRGAALPPRRSDRCTQPGHQSFLGHNCGACRSEALVGGNR